MSAALLLMLFTVLVLATRRYIAFRRTVTSIQNHPGFRTVLSSIGVYWDVFTRRPISGICIGAFRAWRQKHNDFSYFGVDIISHVSAFPTIQQVFYVADPAAIKEITMQRLRFPKPVWQYFVLRFFGDNIVASEFGEWMRFRKIAAPAFSEPNNKLVWEETVHVMNGLFDNVWGTQERIVSDHVVDITLPIALYVIGAAGFGQRVMWTEDGVPAPGYSLTFKEALHIVAANVILKAALPEWFLKYSPIKRMRDIRRAFIELEKYMLDMCATRRTAETREDKHDLFSSLLDASDEDADGGTKLTDRELLGNIFIFLVAGHESTAHTLAFTFALLAFHQDEQEKLYQHIKSVLNDGRSPRYEDMGALKRSEAVFFETLRLFPPVTGIPKYAAEDSVLTTHNNVGEKVAVTIPRGANLSINVAGLHYNPRPIPGYRPRNAFLPFSDGARSCLGRRFFETEGITILTMLVSRYRIELMDEPEFAHETMEEKKARILTCRQGVTTTPVKLPLVFVRR